MSNKLCKFLVDTGAEVSLIKLNSINPFIHIDQTRKINIKGITNGTVQSIGHCFGNFPFEGLSIKIDYDILPNKPKSISMASWETIFFKNIRYSSIMKRNV